MIFNINNNIYKGISYTLVFFLLFEIIFPTFSIAQSGPTQPETTGYNHSSAGENVDNFTGDFSYSIPIIDIEGYPLILSYNSNITMTQEASWVGLGWSLNPGSIARQMRGLPDEFNGNDKINRKFKRKASKTEGKKGGAELSAGGIIPYTPLYVGANISFLKGKYYNNYKGEGKTLEFGIGSNISAGIAKDMGLAGLFGIGIGVGGGLGGRLGFSFDSQNGIGFNPSFNFGVGFQYLAFSGGYSGVLATSYNTREGQKSRTYYSTLTSGLFTYSKSRTTSSVKTFGTQTYIPRFNFNLTGNSTTSRKGGGLYVDLLVVNATINGIKERYSSENSYVVNEKYVSAYGYHNLDLAQEDPEGLMDFNREKERIFSKNMKSLPFSNITYDLYQINTPGISSMFRAYRNDVGTLSDANVLSMTNSSSQIKSKSFGIVYKKVKGLGKGLGISNSGDWENEDGIDKLAFKDKSQEIIGAENFYFKVVGEKTPTDMTLYDNYGGNTPLFLGLSYNSSTNILNSSNNLNSSPTSVFSSLPSQNYKQNREIRGTNITYIYNKEKDLMNEGDIESYDLYTYNSNGQINTTSINDSYRKDHHIGKMIVTTVAGAIYEYGIPVYNLSESEVAFNVEPQINDLNLNNGFIKYHTTSNPDNSQYNIKGRDHFYDKTTLPSYAHSYLLTDIKSSDYIDKTGDGFSADDIGSYVKFNYTRVYGGATPFKWRFPVSEKSVNTPGFPVANYNAGFQTDPLDDKAFYSYGEKEVWYPNSIETKNFILEFYLDDRDDAYPVKGENGELDLNKPSKLLRKIILYNREDRIKNGINATPIKTIEFEYDYSLCKNNPTNKNKGSNFLKSGKLTLKSIRITTGKSKSLYQSPYKFMYGDNISNPNFNYSDMDRWGNYKPNGMIKDNQYFPYSTQDEIEANKNIKAWKLNKIIYPTGGGMSIEYEADSYANIQNKNVMRHYELIGLSNFKELIKNIYNSPYDNYASSTLNLSGQLRDPFKKKRPNNVIYFRLDEPIIATSKFQADNELKRKYFTYSKNGQNKIMEELYYRTKIEVNADNQTGFEFIPGFAKIKSEVSKVDEEYKNYKSEINNLTNNTFTSLGGIGVVGSNNGGSYRYGYIILKTEGIKDKLKNGQWVDKGYQVNPIQKNAWNFVRLNMPWHIYAKCESPTNGDPSIDDCDYGLGADWKTIFTGKINKVLNNNKYCLNLNTILSTIRLMDSRRYKIGGNARVKSITYFDNWDEISGEVEASYTLEYDYTNYHFIIDGVPLKTSGVAAYEPISGNDENIYFQPSYFDIENRLKPDEHHYQIDPIGESVFPSPMVGYSEVTIKFKDIPNVTKNSTGNTKYLYYTYKDYPIKVKKTELRPIDKKINGNDYSYYNVFGVTQGFVVELNDMHGKPKTVITSDAYSNEVSRTSYKYYNFDEKQNVINEQGQIEKYFLGKEVDIYADKKKVVQLNTDIMNMTITEVKAFPLPHKTKNVTKLKLFNAFYASTFQKIINHTAVLKEVEQQYLGNKSNVKTVAYDKYTGYPVVSTEKNEFDDNDYTVIYPAQWRYKELKSKYKNDRLIIPNLTIDNNSNLIGVNNPDNYFLIGDELIIYDFDNSIFFPAIVKGINSNNEINITDISGNNVIFSNDVVIRIINSNYKNRLTDKMASFSIKNDPVTNYSNLTIDPTKVIQSTALEYIENNARIGEYEYSCSGNYNQNYNCNEDLSNPYNLGIIGNWKPSKIYAYQSERVNNDALNGTNIRNDGYIQNFIPFYAYNNGKWNMITEPSHPFYINPLNLQNWRVLNQITQFDRFGKTIETKSQLGIYSSILYGYNNNFKMLPIATATNAKVSQIAYDGFEDYFYLNNEINCNTTGHFDFKDVVPVSNITREDRHTGNYSLKIFPNSSYSVSRKFSGHENIINYETEQKFSPSSGKYIIGVWVKQKDSPQLINYLNAHAKVEIIAANGTVTTTVSFTPSGKIVEGWQRIEGEFIIPPLINKDYNCFRVTLENKSDKIMYFDDLRIHPFVSSMKSFVYDETLLLPLAILDDYNYATYFMYDENLNKVRVRKETERGIYTLSESNLGIKK